MSAAENTVLRQVIKQLSEGKSATEVFLDTTLDSNISFDKIREIELMVKNEQPIVKFDIQNAGRASVLNYNVPNSTSYTGRNYVTLDHPELSKISGFGWFKERGNNDDKGGKRFHQDVANGTVESVWRQYRDTHKEDPKAFHDEEIYHLLIQTALTKGLQFYDPNVFMQFAKVNGLPLSYDELSHPNDINWLKSEYHDLPKIVHQRVLEGYRPYFYFTAAGSVSSGYLALDRTEANPDGYLPRIMLVETYKLTSYLGDYGAGKTVKTFSLLPNEKTKISIKTWKTTETTAKQASSILDSWTRDSSDSFEDTIISESTKKEELKESHDWHAEAEVSAHVGNKDSVWGVEGKVSGGVKGSSSSGRESLAKNVSNATQKQVANASSKRNVEVNTSFETKTVTGEEQLIERQLENVNAGRVLNFVFRQLHQEYITYLHLVDVRLAFSDRIGGGSAHYREFTLGELEAFLDSYIKETEDVVEHDTNTEEETEDVVYPKDVIRRMIVEELVQIFDYRGSGKQFIECIESSSPDGKEVLHNYSDYLDNNKRMEYTNYGNYPKLYLRVNRRQQFYQNTHPTMDNYEKHILPKNCE